MLAKFTRNKNSSHQIQTTATTTATITAAATTASTIPTIDEKWNGSNNLLHGVESFIILFKMVSTWRLWCEIFDSFFFGLQMTFTSVQTSTNSYLRIAPKQYQAIVVRFIRTLCDSTATLLSFILWIVVSTHVAMQNRSNAWSSLQRKCNNFTNFLCNSVRFYLENWFENIWLKCSP